MVMAPMPTETDAQHVRELLGLFAQSMSAPEPARAAAEQQLGALQLQPLTVPFLSALLQHVAMQPDANMQPQRHGDVDGSTRLMACLWIKHFLKRQWKPARERWSAEERAQLRTRLLFAAMHEPHATIALHAALTVATIARGEFPTEWTYGTLFSPLLQALPSDAPTSSGATAVERVVARRRAIDVTYRVVKELATRRLMMHRKQFAMLSVELMPALLQQWCATASAVDLPLVARTDADAGNDSAQGEHVVAMLLTTTKLLATLLLNAFRDLARLQQGELIQAALQHFYQQLERLLALRQTIATATKKTKEEKEEEEMEEMEDTVVITLDKVCFRVAQLVVELQSAYAIEFRAYLTPFLTLFWGIVAVPLTTTHSSTLEHTQDRERHLGISPKLQIQALQFLANVLSCRLYKNDSLTRGDTTVITKVITASGDVALTNAMVLEAQAAVEQFFSAPAVASDTTGAAHTRLEMLLQLVVLHYMKLRPVDLEAWQDDPEGFVLLAESLTAQESVRACAENLFLTLLQHFPQQTTPMLTQLTTAAASWLADELAVAQQQQQQHQQLVDRERRILDIDAVLLAIGLGCYDLHDCFDFEPWFLAHLVPVLSHATTAPTLGRVDGLPILLYRVVWLVSCWLAQLSGGIRAPLYDALLSTATASLASTSAPASCDAALQLRVVQTLEAMLTDWGFARAAFRPFLPTALDCLYAFFPRTAASESKLKVLACLEAVVQACGRDVVAVSAQISAPLPAMWHAGGEAENLVRGKILQLLTKLLHSVKQGGEHDPPAQGEEDQEEAAAAAAGGGGDRVENERRLESLRALSGMCLEVVALATDVRNPDEVFLMESGLELWVETMDSALECGADYSEALHALFANALRLMDRDLEHVSLVMTLLTKYVRVGGDPFWREYHGGVNALLRGLVGNVKAEAALQVAASVDLVVASFPLAQLADCIPVVQRIAQTCLAGAQDPSVREPEGVVVAYLSVLARLLALQAVQQSPSQSQPQPYLEFVVVHVLGSDLSALAALVEMLLAKFFSSVAPSQALPRGKLWAVALSATLEVMQPPILDRMGQILEACADVLDSEREEQQRQQQEEQQQQQQQGEARAGVYRAYQSHRRKVVQQARAIPREDVALMALDLRALVRHRMDHVAASLAPDAFAQLMQTVDSSVQRKLQ